MVIDNINIIDLGSSSVRICRISNGKVLYKKSVVTRLAENKSNGYLDKRSMERTAKAVKDFADEASSLGGTTYIFATAAVRNATNGKEFANYLQEITGTSVEILSGEQEAEIGILGALQGGDGGLIDIGGGSSEIIVAQSGKIEYEKSLQLGGVNLKDMATSVANATSIAKEKVEFFGQVPSSRFYGVGGTITSLTAILLDLKEYDSQKVHGYILTKNQLLRGASILSKFTAEQITQNYCVDIRRAEVLPYGVTILQAIFDKLNLDSIIVSESDNLEGFALKKKGVGYER